MKKRGAYHEEPTNTVEKCYLRFYLCGFCIAAFFVIYGMNFFEGAFFIGLPCGVIIAVATYCDTLKRTVMARFMGLLSAVVSQFILEILGVPYAILMYIFRNDSFVREMGRLTVNETIGYGWGRLFFWGGLIISFIVTIISIFIFDRIKSHSK